MSSIVFVIYFKKCPFLQLLCQAIPFPSNFNKNFFQLLFLFLLLTALLFSVTIAVKVNLYYSVTITVTVNWRNTGVDSTIRHWHAVSPRNLDARQSISSHNAQRCMRQQQSLLTTTAAAAAAAAATSVKCNCIWRSNTPAGYDVPAGYGEEGVCAASHGRA